MSELKKYDLSGKETGKNAVDNSAFKGKENPQQMIKNYLVAIRNNARQWSANTKTRSEVKRSKKKPHAQKGTGRARQGATSAPQYKGGGVVFGPKPKFNQHVRINRKERRAAIQHLLLEKIDQKNVMVLEMPNLKTPKTKKVVEFLGKTDLLHKSVLFVGDISKDVNGNEVFVKSMRNIPKKTFTSISHLNGYSLSVNQVVVVLDTAFDAFKTLVASGGKS